MNKVDSEVWAIVPASGLGERMKSRLPKQYLAIRGKTILERTLDRLLSHPQIEGVVLVLREGDSQWENINYRSDKPVHQVIGGVERLNSVMNGLQALLELNLQRPLALVHDAVRPLVSHRDISRVIQAAINNHAGALLAVPLNDTIKRADASGCVETTISRERLWRALTPQVFDAQLLARALANVIATNAYVTDDASALEQLELRPVLVAGSPHNIKITTAQDLSLAEQILLAQTTSAQES